MKTGLLKRRDQIKAEMLLKLILKKVEQKELRTGTLE